MCSSDSVQLKARLPDGGHTGSPQPCSGFEVSFVQLLLRGKMEKKEKVPLYWRHNRLELALWLCSRLNKLTGSVFSGWRFRG